LILAVISVQAFGPLCNNFTLGGGLRLGNGGPKAPVKVAFLGDQGISTSSSYEVLNMVKGWGADPVVIIGDFDYFDSPSSWRSMMTQVLGIGYPVLAVGGNHDVPAWSGYAAVINEMLTASGLNQYCSGTWGVDMTCDYNGIVYIINQVGTSGSIPNFVASAERSLLANRDRPWKFCGWHKNQRLYQTGDKSDETGYQILDTCRRYGAVVMTAHEHSYSRSVLMDNFATQQASSPRQDKDLQLSHGQSFLAVSGLGGRSLRPWLNDLEKNPWWAYCAATDNNINYGALLCTIDQTAVCELVDITGKVWETFTIRPPINPNAPIPPPSPCSPEFIELGAEESAHQIGTFTFHSSESFSLTESGQTIAIRFTQVPISKSHKIRSIHLQVFGFGPAEGPVAVTIKAENSGFSVPLTKVPPQDRKTTGAEVVWMKDDGTVDWESGQVWVSPNLKHIVEEVLSQDTWMENSALTLIITGQGSPRHVFSRNHGDCFAPTLSITLETC